ncbi:MinD/ParA family protein [Streptomyces sp. NPDC048172]|uniref:MinD/ParA family ATP-binding protein n=1 Tax=Streptomyces sp. NPDC048172 TaxID=3365505 RepID=UPI0037247C66
MATPLVPDTAPGAVTDGRAPARQKANGTAPVRTRPAPEPVPTLDPRLAYAQGAPLHGEPVARRTTRAVFRTVTGSAAQASQESEALAAAIQQPVNTGRQIAVSSIRGGAGKSTVAALTGLILAHYRNDPVVTVEADPALGTLPIRLGAESVRWTCADLAEVLDPSMRLTDVTGYLVPTDTGGWLLPGSQGMVGSSLDLAAYQTVMVALRRYFGATVVDCETLPAEVARTALSAAQARIVVVPATVEGLASTRSVLAWMAALPRSLLPGTVIALNQTTPDATLDIDKAKDYLRVGGADVVHLPYDRHLAAGGAIRLPLLAEHSKNGAARIAAEALTRAVRSGT